MIKSKRKLTFSSDLQKIPSIGPSLASDLMDIGYNKVSDLRGEDPEQMYSKLCALRGLHIDRCVLYAFRCAVYFAANYTHNPELILSTLFCKMLSGRYSQRFS